MSKIYDKAPQQVHDKVLDLIEKYHPELKELCVNIDLLMVSTDSETAPALTHGGYKAAAVVRRTNSKERAHGRGDAEIVIDRDNYDGLDDAEALSLLDHELYHLMPILDKKTGAYKRDEHGRPKLALRKHDRQFGWFDVIASRHGKASYEVKQAEWIKDEAGQVYFGFISGIKKAA
jgi:hypothetical protein